MGNWQDYTRINSYEKFNRVLYGGHALDEDEGKFFTFAGDTPIFMGAASDYSRDTWCYQAKKKIVKILEQGKTFRIFTGFFPFFAEKILTFSVSGAKLMGMEFCCSICA